MLTRAEENSLVLLKYLMKIRTGGVQMQLDDRKWTILKAIVKTYLETGEPVGSRTISKYADLNLSSATITK